MKITVTGANGMLGTDLVQAATQAGHTVVSLDLPAIDITDPASLQQNLQSCDWVVNCAAYTQVDKAEEEQDLAFRVNGEGAGLLAQRCAEIQTPMLHMSTDYVFSGDHVEAYREGDEPAPINVYGASKLAGEEAVGEVGGEYLVVRVESLFGKHGKNFVRTIASRALAGQEEFRVVMDQVCSPSYTRHLSGGLLQLMQSGHRGTVHMTASGSCSWFDFAAAIVASVGSKAEVTPVPSTEYPTPAARPRNSVMDNSRFREWTGGVLPGWQDGLTEYVNEEGWR